MADELSDWIIHKMGERVDSFNQGEFKAQMEQVLEKGAKKVALDLQHTSFLSFPCIRLIVAWATELNKQGGQMMLIAPSEKLKRQIFIYGSLDHLIVTKVQESAGDRPATPPISESPVLDGNPDF